MEAPAVSGVTACKGLCLAAKTEEKYHTHCPSSHSSIVGTVGRRAMWQPHAKLLRQETHVILVQGKLYCIQTSTDSASTEQGKDIKNTKSWATTYQYGHSK